MTAPTTAERIAALTPSDRNRVVDLLRVVSLFAVVYGHWLLAMITIGPDGVTVGNALTTGVWAQWLTWVFQVMPLFFVVGGYVNGRSWSSARARGDGYGAWLIGRCSRLVRPTLAFGATWLFAAPLIGWFGADSSLLAAAAQVVAVPLWFLAVYLLVIALVPLTVAAHRRFGLGAFAGLTTAALAVDAAVGWVPALGWLNFLFVWAAIHQLGYVWRDGVVTSSPRAMWSVTAGSLGVLLALTVFGPYPISMVGVPGAEASNNSPPTVALIALGMTQFGAAMLASRRLERMLARPSIWAAVVAASRMAMTVYLWHLTALVIVTAALLAASNPFLAVEPLSVMWWASRPIWFAMLTAGLVPLVALFSRFDQFRIPPNRRPPAGAVLVGVAAASAAYAFAALEGFYVTAAPGGVNLIVLGALAVAAAVFGIPLGPQKAGRIAADR